jgi:hypothetical protein
MPICANDAADIASNKSANSSERIEETIRILIPFADDPALARCRFAARVARIERAIHERDLSKPSRKWTFQKLSHFGDIAVCAK